MFSVTASGLEEAVAGLSDIERTQLPFALALALTRTAQVVAQDIRAEMSAVFDRPTPATLNSLFLEPATKQKLTARVWIKDGRELGGRGVPVGRGGVWGKGQAASTWLTPEIYGGPRSHKGIDSMLRRRGVLKNGQYVLPGRGAELDQYGNLPRGLLSKVRSGAGLNTEEGYRANATNSRRSRVKRNNRFFVMHDKKRGPFAVAERTSRARTGLRIVLAFVNKTPTYRSALDFFGIAEQVAQAELPEQFRRAMAEALRTRRKQ
ncbi:hypothetical protein [Metapseudomonas otitidis]|uniref:hypothetical protein n=1 Tax=Metapseudomonas otitidis TaxID=319939 RepID=UPI00209AD226|nr:hypothetical protein [Pseudomonas otitidis]MCO7557467.1 hypothetical protein [Pseudomonas otitidis]